MAATPVPEVPVDKIPVIRPAVKKLTEVVIREPGGDFRIVHPKAVRLARGSNLESWEARLQFQRRLEQLKVTNALKRAGIETGDTVLVDTDISASVLAFETTRASEGAFEEATEEGSPDAESLRAQER